MRGVVNDAIAIYLADATIASAFVARKCAGHKAESTDGLFRVREDEPMPRIGRSRTRRRKTPPVPRAEPRSATDGAFPCVLMFKAANTRAGVAMEARKFWSVCDRSQRAGSVGSYDLTLRPVIHGSNAARVVKADLSR
jgi:hypothetical protein